jgi:hypothetical protein
MAKVSAKNCWFRIGLAVLAIILGTLILISWVHFVRLLVILAARLSGRDGYRYRALPLSLQRWEQKAHSF